MERSAEQMQRTVLIDDSGWGDPILGVVIGVLDLPAGRYFERKILPVFFQPPRFERQDYLDRAVEIVEEAIEVMKIGKEAKFRVCQGYILLKVRQYLRSQDYKVEDTVITGDLQKRIEKSFLKWCEEVGVPKHLLKEESGKPRFWVLMNWVKENPKVRENLVKTGWKSWNERWKEYVYS